jgi:hypothetical protein
MKYSRYPMMKDELKQLAKEIREWKDNRKQDKRALLKMELWDIQGKIDWRKNEFRHIHIAYCMLRGRTYEQIEKNCRVLPNFNRIDKLIEDNEQKTICVNS